MNGYCANNFVDICSASNKNLPDSIMIYIHISLYDNNSEIKLSQCLNILYKVIFGMP